MPIAYVGIGSNLGNRERNCRRALTLLSSNDIFVQEVSSPYETEPWGITEQPVFINMAAKIETVLAPVELLTLIKKIEVEAGRQKTYHWGPRVVDIDILLFNGLVISESGLKIPHPLMHQREFVLRPLSEIAPDIIHPGLKKTIGILLSELKNKTS